MKKKKILAGALAATMFAASLSSCGNTTSTSTPGGSSAANSLVGEDFNSLGTTGTTITFWHSMGGVNGEAMTYLVDEFNSENTHGITVEAIYQGSYDDAINKLKSAQIGNMGADLVQIYDIWIPDMHPMWAVTHLPPLPLILPLAKRP